MKLQHRSKTSQPDETNRTHVSTWRMAQSLSVLTSMILMTIPAQAGLLYWDALQSKTGMGGGGTGNWNTTSLDWYPGSGSTDQAWSNSGTANTAAFAGTAGVVTLTSAISANRLTFPVGGYTLTNNTLTLNGTSPTIDVKTGTTTIGSALAGGLGLVVSGTGNLVLSGPNTYTKATTVNGATLTLDFSQSVRSTDIIDASLTTAYINMNGCTLALNGKNGSVNSQSFIGANGLALRAASAVTFMQNGASSLSLNILGIARNVGATVDFTLPAAGGVATTFGAANTLMTVNNVPFATVGGVDWAAKDGANAKIVAGSGISGFYTPSTATSLSGNADVASGVNTTLAVAPTTTSLRFNVAEARTITMNTGITLTPLGILISPNVGNNLTTITGGRLRGGSGNDLVLIQNNTANSLLINSQIINSGTTMALTKSGPGLVTLTGANIYTGQNHLNDGTLSISSNANLGEPTATGPIINFAGGTLLATETLALDNGGVNPRNVTLLGKGGTFAVRAGKTLTVLGTIGNHANGVGPLTVGTVGETGTLVLAGTSTYTEPTSVQAGTLAVNGTIVSPVIVGDNAVLTGTGSISATTAAVTVNNGGVLDPGTAGTIGTLAVSGNVAFASDGTFQVQADGENSDLLTVSGNVTSESGSVSVVSTGTGSGPWKIMTAAAITPTFIAADPNMILKKLFNNTELWLERNSGTVIVVR